jgi:beta-galactosidase/beta-glucuronidase
MRGESGTRGDARLERGYPRPQLVRERWLPLNGAWEFAVDEDARWRGPASAVFDRVIQVPFAPETEASGIALPGFFQACWYRRAFALPARAEGERVLLHFGAVDYHATVWIDGALARMHEGGYTPFSIDITDFLSDRAEHELVVRAEDDPHDLAKPRGKQDWQREPHSIWYPRTTGIWQTVWLEIVPRCRIASLRWTPSLEHWSLGLEVQVEGDLPEGVRLDVRLAMNGAVVADDTYRLVGRELARRIALSDPGIEDSRNDFLWRPGAPRLFDVALELRDRSGLLLDRVQSYTALRAVGLQGELFVLNGRPLQLRMVLDQGYWPESGLTAPSDAALRRDVELAQAMGFNGVRKHQKIEDPRYLYWADRLGLLVWEEMPSAYRFTRAAIERLTQQWIAAVHRDSSHPCVVAWVPFNESWGVPNLPDIASERHFVQGLYHLTKTLDTSRPVVGNDGWESIATDIIGIHDYDQDTEHLCRRYESEEMIPRLFRRQRPGGRQLTLEGHPHSGQPIMLTEFGGIALNEDPASKGWGYASAGSAAELATRYAELLKVVRNLSLFAGFCYTQFADTYQETNGLLYADRRPKFPLEQIRAATVGAAGPLAEAIEREWRERVLMAQSGGGTPGG